MNSVLITGGAGYIGSVLTSLLLKEGFLVTVLDNLSFSQCSLLPNFAHPHFRFIKGEVTNEKLMKSLYIEHQIIIPLAAIVGAPACNNNPALAKSINYDAIEFLLANSSHDQQILFQLDRQRQN